MTLYCNDSNVYDGTAVLTADISEGAYASMWNWNSENKVVWSSEVNGGGTVYGSGTKLTISTPGTYYCTLLGSADGFTTTEKCTAITVNGTNINVSKIFVGDARIRNYNIGTGGYDRTIRVGDIVATRIYVGEQLVHDDRLFH